MENQVMSTGTLVLMMIVIFAMTALIAFFITRKIRNKKRGGYNADISEKSGN